MKSMNFGATCSPSYAQKYTRANESIIRNQYVDDLLDSMDDEKSAVDVTKQFTFSHS